MTSSQYKPPSDIQLEIACEADFVKIDEMPYEISRVDWDTKIIYYIDEDGDELMCPRGRTLDFYICKKKSFVY